MPPPVFLLTGTCSQVQAVFATVGRNRRGSNPIEQGKSLDHGLTLLKQADKDMKFLSISPRHSLFHTSSCWLTPPCPTDLLVHLFQPPPPELDSLFEATDAQKGHYYVCIE